MSATITPAKDETYDPLWTSQYALWFMGDTGVTLGASLRSFAMPLLVVALTGSPAQAGIISTVSMLIGLIAALPGGVIVDWFDRRIIMYLYATIGCVLWGLAALLIMTDNMTFWILLAITSIGSLSTGVLGQATDVALRSIVSTTNYPKAQAANQGRDATIQLVSGPVGGVLYTLFIWLPFAIAAGGYLTLAAAARFISTDLSPCRTDDAPRKFWTDFTSGLMWLWRRKLLVQLTTVLLVFNAGFSGTYIAFILILADRGTSATTIGSVSLTIGAALLIGSAVAGKFVVKVPTGATTITSMTIIVLAIVPPVFNVSLPVILTSCAIIGLTLPLVNASAKGFLAAIVPIHLQGRVFSAFGFFSQGFAALAPGVVGFLIERVSPFAATGFCLALAGAGAILASFSHAVRMIPTPEHWKEYADRESESRAD